MGNTKFRMYGTDIHISLKSLKLYRNSTWAWQICTFLPKVSATRDLSAIRGLPSPGITHFSRPQSREDAECLDNRVRIDRNAFSVMKKILECITIEGVVGVVNAAV